MGQLTAVIQSSFAAGELSSAVSARVDLAKYRAGLALARNFFIMAYGGAATRPGTAICGRCKQLPPTKPRDIPFIYGTLQAYMLEFGDFYMRPLMNGGYILEPSFVIAGVTRANPGVFHIVGHGYAPGDQVFINGAAGMPQINSTAGYQYKVATVPDVDHVTFTDLDGNAVNTTAFGVYTGGGVAARLFTLVTPYAVADLPLLKYTQSADVMTLTHPNYAPRDLTRTEHWVWTLSSITFAAQVQVPTSVVLTQLGSAATTLDFYYVVTALTDAPAEESLPTVAAVVKNEALNQNTGINNQVAWTAPATGPTPTRYNVFGSRPVLHGAAAPTVFGYIGQTTSTSFVDTNIAPDYTQAPPSHANPFSGSNYPGCSSYFQGRKAFAAPAAFPETIYLTQSNNFKNMDVHIPVQDNDAVTASLTAQQVNAIKHLLSMNNALLALTSSGAWMISGGSQSDVVTPASIVATAQAFNGCADVPPIPVNYDILYVQARGSKVRDLAYNFYVNLYTGNDISVLSNHLFFGYQIVEWCYQEEPYYQILAVRNDGQILSFTYLKEQDVYAWTHYDTPGNTGTDLYQSISSIPEGQENAVYMVVERTIPGVNAGAPVYYQERQASRNFYTNGAADVTKPWCVDSGIEYVGAPTRVITGLDHLNGCMVSILADGSVQRKRLVVNGKITLDAACSRVIVGLGFVCQLQTLRLDTGEPTIQGKRKKISRCSLITQDTRGLKMAPMTANGGVGPLREFKERSTQNYGAPIPLKTGLISMILSPQWQLDGSVFMQQDNPLPATVLACIPNVMVGN